MLSPEATCAFGECCVECQYLPVHKVCREQVSSCDLPEYCNGTSEWCPEDVYVQDGAPCSDGAYSVRDGTPCGTEMMCINGECKNVSLLKYDCNVTKCHNRGICNTYKHCHCDYGWAPPDCLNQGNGGSIDSGPPPPRNTSKHSVNMTGIIAAIVFLVSTIFARLRVWFV
uniref:Disintegrin domain-containing protein n=1 Tax=Podarcis muralis TaxID=64176 RepID=A0A670K2Q5_PODMU